MYYIIVALPPAGAASAFCARGAVGRRSPLLRRRRHAGAEILSTPFAPPPSPAPTLLKSLLMRLPLAFALLFFGWPVVTGMQPLWWALVGLLFYGGLSAWAVGGGRCGGQRAT